MFRAVATRVEAAPKEPHPRGEGFTQICAGVFANDSCGSAGNLRAGDRSAGGRHYRARTQQGKTGEARAERRARNRYGNLLFYVQNIG